MLEQQKESPKLISGKHDVEHVSAEEVGRQKNKTPLRMRYEAEARVIGRRLGGLEAIRTTLGLSQRKICQLLMVDPSAWVRWTKGTTSAPPHIFRMLQWYLAINEKLPGLDTAFWIQSSEIQSENLQLRRLMEAGVEGLKGELESLKGELVCMKKAAAESHETRARKTRTPFVIGFSLFSLGCLCGWCVHYFLF